MGKDKLRRRSQENYLCKGCRAFNGEIPLLARAGCCAFCGYQVIEIDPSPEEEIPSRK